MDCTDIKVVLSGLVDGTLAAERRHEAERHLMTCEPCRALLEQAESLDQLVAEDIALLQPGSLPDSFEAAVLSQTVFAQPRAHTGRWQNWTGWLAAAACLGLAVTIWVNDRKWMNNNSTTPNDVNTEVARARPYEPFGQSETYDGPPSVNRGTGATINLATFDPTISIRPSTTHVEPLDPSMKLDDLAIGSTAMVLETLLEIESDDTEAIETLRQITTYDNLVPRLKLVRAALPPSDRDEVQQALLIVQQIASDKGLTADDVAMSRRLIAEQGLVGALDRIVARIGPFGA